MEQLLIIFSHSGLAVYLPAPAILRAEICIALYVQIHIKYKIRIAVFLELNIGFVFAKLQIFHHNILHNMPFIS
jgi:hypothetical protein